MFTVSAVAGSRDGPCAMDEDDERLVGFRDERGRDVCLTLGEALLDGDDVRFAQPADPALGEGGSVSLTLTEGGARRLREVAADRIGSQAALVVGGRVVQVVAFQATDLGETLIVNGLSDAEMTLLLDAFPSAGESDGGGHAGAARALEVCERRKPPEVGDAALVAARETTAGAVARLGDRVSGERFEPWATLADDHFVASCTYEANANAASTTVCPNGDSVVLDAPRLFLVDDEGRTTPDQTVTGGMAGAAPPCAIAGD